MSCSRDAEHCNQIAGSSGAPEATATWASGRGSAGHCDVCGGFLTRAGVCNQPHVFSMSLAGGAILGAVDTPGDDEILKGICPKCGAELSVTDGEEDWCIECEDMVTAKKQVSIDGLIDDLRHEDVWGVTIDELVAQDGDPALVPALVKVLKDPDAESHSLSGAILVLSGIDNPTAISALVEMLEHSSSGVRNLVLNIFCRKDFVPPKAVIKPLSQMILKDRSKKNQWVAAEVLGATGDKQAIPALIAGLKKGRTNKDLVISACKALQVLGEPLTPHFETLIDDKSPRTRQSVISNLSGLNDPAAIPVFEKALSDEYWGVRVNAVMALGKLGSITAIPALEEALSDEEESVRFEAQEAIQEIKGAIK